MVVKQVRQELGVQLKVTLQRLLVIGAHLAREHDVIRVVVGAGSLHFDVLSHARFHVFNRRHFLHFAVRDVIAVVVDGDAYSLSLATTTRSRAESIQQKTRLGDILLYR